MPSVHPNILAVADGKPVPLKPVLTSPDGTEYLLVVDDDGVLSTAPVAP